MNPTRSGRESLDSPYQAANTRAESRAETAAATVVRTPASQRLHEQAGFVTLTFTRLRRDGG
jgi:hypothetical protein